MSFRDIGLITMSLLVVACASDEPAGEAGESGASGGEGEGIVDVIARDLTLVAPDTVAPGWTTFRFTNTSPMVHFAVVERMPDGVGLAEQQEEVAPLFQEGFDLLTAGDADGAMAAFGALPDWFGEIVFMGGPGLLSPGGTADASVHLEPGTYLLECYVKTDGVFHSYHPEPGVVAMVHEFVVAGPPTGATAPEEDVRVTISTEDGISVEGTLLPGRRTVAVTFVDQTVHENFVGHDVHVARMENGITLEAIEAWMDWTRPEGLQSPSPVRFVGGINEMPAGTTGYFTADFQAGDYVWVSEVPAARAKNMLVPFTVGGS
jgi:hypothetical protein